MFCFSRAPIDEIGEVITFRILQVADADANQAEPGSSDFMREKIAAGSEDTRRELRGGSECTRARANLEIGTLEFERYGRARKRARFEASRYAFGQIPQLLFEQAKLADVTLESGFG